MSNQRKGYSLKGLSAFCLQISLLLDAAVPLDEGLRIMAEDASAQWEKDMLLQMAEDRGLYYLDSASVWQGWGKVLEQWMK